MYLTDEQIMLLEQLTYLTDDVADAAGVLLGPYDSVENLLQQFGDDALQRLEDPGNPDSTKPNGQWLKSIRFKLPIIENDLSIGLDNGNQVETVVLLSKGEIDSKKVRVEFSLEDMDMSGFQNDATYSQIKERVLQQTGLKVSSLYIAQIKQKHGIIERENYNKPKSENTRQPKCPPEKEAAITEALKYFGMI